MYMLYIFLLTTATINCRVTEDQSYEEWESDTHFPSLQDLEDDDDFRVKEPIEKQYFSSVFRSVLEESDPLYINRVNGDVGSFHFRLNDTSVIGMKKCDVGKVTVIDQDANNLKYVRAIINCPYLIITGKYDVNGELIIVPVQGDGDYIFHAEDYVVSSKLGLKTVMGKDGRYYYKIKNYALKMQPRGHVTYRASNLYNGNRQLSDAFHRFANENYKAISSIIQDPFWYAAIKPILKKVNKSLKPLSIEDVIIDETRSYIRRYY